MNELIRNERFLKLKMTRHPTPGGKISPLTRSGASVQIAKSPLHCKRCSYASLVRSFFTCGWSFLASVLIQEICIIKEVRTCRGPRTSSKLLSKKVEFLSWRHPRSGPWQDPDCVFGQTENILDVIA